MCSFYGVADKVGINLIEQIKRDACVPKGTPIPAYKRFGCIHVYLGLVIEFHVSGFCFMLPTSYVRRL